MSMALTRSLSMQILYLYTVMLQVFPVARIAILGPLAPSTVELPFFLARLPAGFPSPAQEYLERFSIDDLMGLHRPQLFVARVEGRSLTGIGILDGDLVVIDKALEARREDVIAACINGENLLKIFDFDQHQVVLRSANPKYPPRYVLEAEELHVWGVYVGLCRHGRRSG